PVASRLVPGTESMVERTELRVGGAAGNAGFALHAMGAPYNLIGSVGDDVFGRWLAQAFGSAARRWPRSAAPTTVSVGITHPNGERTFLTSKGHLETLSLADVQDQMPRRAGAGDIALLLGGFLSPLLLESYEKLLDRLANAGFGVALDPSWPPGGWTRKMRLRVAGWLRACDHVLLNEAESCGLSGQSRIAGAARWIQRRAKPGATVVVKRGSRGASAWQEDRAARAPAPKVKVIDTIGAGDVFDAAYLRARLRGAGLGESLVQGVATASAVISTYPRQYRMTPSRRGQGK
ncbi:MAG: carbohydrate kinase family protein, partial [Gemmatimonadales bacterium]